MKKIKVINGYFPKDLYIELSGINEYNGFVLANKTIGGKLVKTAMRGIANSPKTGGVYVHKRIGPTRASQVGTYPADQSGQLRKSISFKRKDSINLEVGSENMSNESFQYAKALQSDSLNGLSKLNRPFLSLAHRENEKNFQNDMSNAMMSEVID